jgi:hypothetical protein
MIHTLSKMNDAIALKKQINPNKRSVRPVIQSCSKTVIPVNRSINGNDSHLIQNEWCDRSETNKSKWKWLLWIGRSTVMIHTLSKMNDAIVLKEQFNPNESSCVCPAIQSCSKQWLPVNRSINNNDSRVVQMNNAIALKQINLPQNERCWWCLNW